MDAYMEELYKEVSRRGEGDFHQTPEYEAIAKRQIQLYREMILKYGPELSKLLREYMAAVCDEFSYETRWYFEQGYLAAVSGDPKKGRLQNVPTA